MENSSKRQLASKGRPVFAQHRDSGRGACADGGHRAHIDWYRPSASFVLFEIVCGLGLACNFVWCTLEGHADGFLAFAQELNAVVNSRFFFQLGLVLASTIMIALPRALRRADGVLAWVFPALGVLATFFTHGRSG